MKLKLIFYIFLFSFGVLSCSKANKLNNNLEGRTWDATVNSNIGGNSEVYTGQFIFDKDGSTYSTTLTDSQGNTTTNENLTYFVGPEATTITLSDTSGSYEYQVSQNEKKFQEWIYIETVNSVQISNNITLSR